MHRLAQKDQGGDRHHEADHGARERPLGQQCLRDRDRSEDIRVHGHPDQRSDHHTEWISTAPSGIQLWIRAPIPTPRSRYGNTFRRVKDTCP